MKKERTFKVIADTCEGLGKKIYNGGDVVKESNFSSGRADLLVSRKFLKEIDAPEPTKEQLQKQELEDDILSNQKKEVSVDLHTTPAPASELTDKEIEKLANNDLNSENIPVKDNAILGDDDKMKNISVQEIIDDLNKAKVKFDVNSSKEELYKLWLLI